MLRAERLILKSVILGSFCSVVFAGAGTAMAASGDVGRFSAEPILASGLTWLDGAVITAYGVGLLVIGWYFSRRTRDTEDYLLGGRNMRSGSVGLSLFATLLSTITYLSIPGEMSGKGPIILWTMVSIPIAYVIMGYLLIPHLMRLKVTSAYEILEKSLGVKIRLMAAIIFLATRLLWMALIIYITADKVIVVMMGWDPADVPYVAGIIGVITIIYTSMGGLRAVVFTDVLQSFILLGGAILAIILITRSLGGVGAWWPTQWAEHWDHQPFFPESITTRATVIGSVVMMTLWWVCTAGSDQMAIQRYLATRDAAGARRTFLVTGIANIVVTSFLAALGFALMGLYQAHPERFEGLGLKANADSLFPHYIVTGLPAGITGLVISGLLAAAMSSLSSGINSSCSVISVDFIDRFRRHRHRSERAHMNQVRIIAVCAGAVAVSLSMVMDKVHGNITEVTTRTNHLFTAPLFGLFFMALFVRRATPAGTLAGAIAGCAVGAIYSYWEQIRFLAKYTDGQPLSFQFITLASLLAFLVVALPASWLTYRPTAKAELKTIDEADASRSS